MNTNKAKLLLALLRLQSLRNALQALADDDASPEEIGRRVLLMLWCVDRSAFRRQRNLALRLGLTEARTSQLLRRFKKTVR